MTALIVCGGRKYDDEVTLHHVLHLHVPRNAVVFEGGNRPPMDKKTGVRPHYSADWLAHLWCIENNVATFPVFPNWYPHGKYDPGAGPKRNSEMLEMARQKGLVLGISFPGGTGTADMVGKLTCAGIPVIEVPA